MSYFSKIIEGDWNAVRRNFRKIGSSVLGPNSHPIFNELTLNALTASRLIASDANKKLVSSDLASWVTGTANEIDITDDGDGTITIGIVNPLIVAKGGTGLATITDHGILLGSGTGAITPLGVASNGYIPIGSAGADPVLAAITGTSNQIVVTNAAGSITLSTPQDIHTTASPQFTGIELGHASDTTITRASAGDLNIESNIVYRAGGTDVPVTDGGTGVATLTDHGILLGSGTDAITPLGAAADGQLPIGSTGVDPVLATITGTAKRVTVTNGAGTITLSGPQDLDTVDTPAFSGLTLTGNLVLDTNDISTDTTTGTKIGTGATQKLGFFGVTPVVQQATIIDADGTLEDITTKFNTLLSEVEALGLLAS